jgi:hypothetical protein
MSLPTEIPDEIREYLGRIIADDADRNRDHIIWLGSPEAANEEDRDQQRAETERAIELASKAQAYFPVPE